MRCTSQMIASVALLATLSCAPAMAGLMMFTDRLTFDAAAPGLALEDFEAGTAPGGFSLVGTIVNSTTSAGNISPGDILPGVDVTSVSDSVAGVLASVGPDLLGLTSYAIVPDLFSDELRLGFAPSITAAGFDLISLNNDGTVDALFYNVDILLGSLTIGVTSTGLSFGGAIATDGEVITRIDFTNEVIASQAVAIDNLSFGNPNSVPAPATLALVGLGLAGLSWSRRRKV